MAAATAAAQAAAIATNPLMDDHMTNALNIEFHQLRGRLIIAGFTDDIDRLSTKPDSFAIKACSGVRKSGGLPAALLYVEIEEDLINLVRWVRCTYIVQKPLAWVDATIPDTRALANGWISCHLRQMLRNLESSKALLPSGDNMRTWFNASLL